MTAADSLTSASSKGDGGLKRFVVVHVVAVLLLGSLSWAYSANGAHAQHVHHQIPVLGFLALLSVAIQWIVFLHAGGALFGNERTEKFFDLTGSITFATLTLVSVWFAASDDDQPLQLSSLSRQLVLSGCVLLWCIRLGSFLFGRISGKKIPAECSL